VTHGRSNCQSRSSLGVIEVVWVLLEQFGSRQQLSCDFVEKKMGVWLLVFAGLYSG
jgi:hypothetical protein